MALLKKQWGGNQWIDIATRQNLGRIYIFATGEKEISKSRGDFHASLQGKVLGGGVAGFTFFNLIIK